MTCAIIWGRQRRLKWNWWESPQLAANPRRVGEGLRGVWGGFCPFAHCTYEWGCTGMSNLMNVNCLRPELRSGLLWLRRKKTTETGNEDTRAQKSRGKRGRWWSAMRDVCGRYRDEGWEEHDVTLLQGLSCSFLNHHLLLFKNILSFNA